MCQRLGGSDRGLPIDESDLDADEKKAYKRLKAHRTKLASEATHTPTEPVSLAVTASVTHAQLGLRRGGGEGSNVQDLPQPHTL